MTEAGDGRVIIVGAGPVGLGAALELARCGVRSVLIEKHDTTSWHPKTRLAELGGFARAYGPLDEDGAVLVRPDGHVAWRSAAGPGRDGVPRDAIVCIVAR